MFSQYDSLRARRQEILENLESAEKYHWSEESQLNLLEQLHDIDDQIDRFWQEEEEGKDD